MPIEVIDLLSSSSSPEAARVDVASHRTRVSWNKKTTVQTFSQIDPSSDSFLDLTEITSEKRLRQEPMQKTSHGLIAPPERAYKENDDFLFLADDFDTTGDLDTSTAVGSWQPSVTSKSHKLNNGQSLTQTTSTTAATRGSYLSLQAGLKRWNTIADPIEHSSSPVDLTYIKDAPQKNAKALNHNKSIEIETIHSSDPFASSPPNFKSRSPKKQHEPGPRQTAAWDPISSSMPEIGMGRCDDEDDNPFVSSPPRGQKRTSAIISLSDSDDDGTSNSEEDLPELTALATAKAFRSTKSYMASPPTKRAKRARASVSDRDSRAPPKTEEEKEQERMRRAKEKEEEKERKRTERERVKAQRMIEKGKEKALAKVNKLRTDKKVSTPEMIVDLPSSLPPGVKVQAQALLGDLDVEFSGWASPIDNIVKWRRKVQARFNEALGHWEPIPLRVEAVNHIMVVIQAAEFVKLALGTEGCNLEAHVLKMKTQFPDNTLIYLIEGLKQWMNKNRNARNRQFQSAVRNLAPTAEEAPTSSQPQPHHRRQKASPQHDIVDDDTIEDALLSLQVVHGALIHHTNAPIETAQWIAVFTQHISTIPYRRAREASSASAGFCMESGQVRTGDGPRDTYIHMLQEISRVTAPMAYGIAAEYGTVSELVKGLEANGPLALEHCRKSANKDGAFTDRTVGQAVSRRLYRIFTGTDENSMDI